MKKIIFAGFLAFASTCFALSQDILPVVAFNKNKPVTEAKEPLVTSAASNPLPLIEVDQKILKDFYRSFENATDIRWYAVEKKGTAGYYNVGEKKGRCFYDKRGRFVYSILTYSEQSLPMEVRDLVKRTYYFDYTIDLAEEVHANGETFYIVHVSDSKTIKLLIVYDGEINVYKEYNKSK